MIKVDYSNLIKKIGNLKDTKKTIMPQAYTFFKSITPIQSGNARNKTRLDNNNDIQANYAYAERLDNGWSKQAPYGMTKPTEQKIKTLVKQYIKKSGS